MINVTPSSSIRVIGVGEEYRVSDLLEMVDERDALRIRVAELEAELLTVAVLRARIAELEAPPERRAPVQDSLRYRRAPGTVSWEEHERAWETYALKYGRSQSAERIAERGGFSYGELVIFLGHEPTTWRQR